MRKPRGILLFTLVALLFAVTQLSCRESDSRDGIQRVVLISVDTLRADRLHCYGYSRNTSPSIDRLASQGILFENAQVPRGSTWPSLTRTG